MKIHLLSDLHLEFGAWAPPPTDADVVVLAGDIHLGERGVAWAREQFSVPVIYVPGNHEFYKQSLSTLDAKLHAAAAGSAVHVLTDGVAVLNGVRFVGATLWTDFALYGESPEAMRAAQLDMTDYKKIRVGESYRRARPADTRALHLRSLQFLKATLASPFEGPTVVVTHHAPSPDCVAPEYRGTTLSSAYASHLEALFGPAVALWMHGHMHHSLDFEKHGTRVACNPRGYHPKELNPGFVPDRVIVV